MKKSIALILTLGAALATFVSCGEEEKKHEHSYDALGNCTGCDETLSKELVLVDDVYKAPIQNGKVYFNFKSVCLEKGFYVDLSQIGDYSEHPEDAPDLIKSIEIYKEGTTTNLITESNYHKELDFDYWYYSTDLSFEAGKTYYTVINFDKSYKEENIELYVSIDCLQHRYDDYGHCYAGDDDISYALTANETNTRYSFTATEPAKADYLNCSYFVANLESGIYTLKINGEEYDEAKYQVTLAIKIDEGSSSYYTYNKDIGFNTTKSGKYGLAITPKGDEKITSVMLTKDSVRDNANYAKYTGEYEILIGRGVLLKCTIAKGIFAISKKAKLMEDDGSTVVFSEVCTGIYLGTRTIETAEAGDAVGIMIRGLEASKLENVKYIVFED